MKTKVKQKKQREVVSVRIAFDEHSAYKYTKYSDGSIAGEPITGEEAALIHAQEGGY